MLGFKGLGPIPKYTSPGTLCVEINTAQVPVVAADIEVILYVQTFEKKLTYTTKLRSEPPYRELPIPDADVVVAPQFVNPAELAGTASLLV